MLAGPYATMLLADLGADVVKVEPPSGDNIRRVGPFREGDGPDALGGYFQSVNRGKRGVVLDLKTDDGRADFLELVRHADIVAENFSAGVMDRLGLGYEQLRADNPRLVYAAIRGFGDPRTGRSPYAEWPALDVVAQAMGGFLSITGTVEGMPIKSGPGIGDLFPATLLALGIVSAVHDAQRTGEGQFVDVAMYDAVLSLSERIVYQYSYTGEIPGRQGNSHPMLCPFDIFPTADGWVALAASSDRHWRTIAETIGRPDMVDDPLYRHNEGRSRNSRAVREAIQAWLGTTTTDEAVSQLGGRVPIGPVNDAGAIFADPHIEARQMLARVEQPGSDRPVTIAGQPIKMSKTPSEVNRRAPLLGEHDPRKIAAQWAQLGRGARDRG
jgi:crotonobetainyl-CoA:carnitine CoA-transferase CaiB-like acyl-CoA transferase